MDEFLKYVPKENKALLPQDTNEIVLGMDYIRETMMTTLIIEKSVVNSDRAELTLTGSRDLATASGKVIMVQEESWSL